MRAPTVSRRANRRRKNTTADLLRFERLLADLSARFISLPPADVPAAIEAALHAVVETLDLDRSILFRLQPDTNELVSEHAWTRGEYPMARLGNLSRFFPWAIDMVRSGRPVVFSSLDELPPEAAADKASWRANKALSHVCCRSR
jgi:hypothetical protein